MESPEEIIYRFWNIRSEYYKRRKINKLSKLKEQCNILKSKINFVQEIMDDKIKVFRVKLEDINKQLESKKYHKVENSYKYLTDMKIHSFSEDTISELDNKYIKVDKEHSVIYNMTISDFWKKDLNEL